MRREVWMIDPIHLTPYYDAALCQALVNMGWSVRQFTSPFLYDPGFATTRPWEIDYLYGRGLNGRFWLNYPRLRRSLRTVLYLSGHRQLLRRMQAAPPDVVHLQWSRIPRLDRILVGRIQRLGIPVVHTVHDIEPLFAYASTERLAQVYALADRLIVHTHANRAALLTQYPGIAGDKVEVIPHIAIDFPIPGWADRETARRALGIPVDARVVLFFGTARSYKGLNMLLEAFLRARSLRHDLWLVVAGLQDTAMSAITDSQMTVHRHYISSDFVWAYHLAADIAVFPYQRVSQSGALITAMGFCLPVIVTDVGGLPETLGGNGWVVPHDSAVALSHALLEAVSDVDRLRQMGEESRRRVSQCHAPTQVARRTVALYEELVASCNASYSALTV